MCSERPSFVLSKGHRSSLSFASTSLQSPGQLVGEYKEAWKIHKLHNQPLRLGHLTLFIASCPRKPFTNREALRGVSGTCGWPGPCQAEVPQHRWEGQLPRTGRH